MVQEEIDVIDKLMIQKYCKESLLIKDNYVNCKMQETNYIPKEVYEIKEYIRCTDNKKMIEKFYKLIEKQNKLNTDKKTNKTKFEKLKQEIRDLSNPNRMYERLGCDIINICVGSALLHIIDPDKGGCLLPSIAACREKMTDSLGYIIPNMRIMDSSLIEPDGYCMRIRHREVYKNILSKDLSDDEKINDIITNLQKMCIKYAPQIITKAYIIKLIELVRAQDPTLVNDLVPILLSAIDIKLIIIKLIQEQISIRDILYIFELLNDYARFTNNVDILTEQLKRDLQF